MSNSSCFPPEQQQHHSHLSEKLCYVKCTLCQTVLAVSVPCSSLFKTVAVRCGHCSNLFSLNMHRVLLPPNPNNQLHFGNSLFPPQNLPEEFLTSSVNQINMYQQIPTDTPIPFRGIDELPKPAVVNRPPEKRQRVPSAYNRFIKDEIQRIKAGNPDISHREAFSAAAKNWAHFPHIQFGMMPDQSVKKHEGDDVMMKDGIHAPASNMGVSPY